MDYQQPDSSIIEAPAPPPGVFGTKIPVSVTFAIGVLLFLLPFAELKCKGFGEKESSIFSINSSNKFSFSNTGLGLATGSEWKFNMPDMGPLFNNPEDGMAKKYQQTTKPNTYAIIALVLAVVGLGLAFVNKSSMAAINIATGVLAAGALVGLMFDLKQEVNTKLGKDGSGEMFDKPIDNPFTLSFTPWFYIAIVAFLVAAFFSYKRMMAMK